MKDTNMKIRMKASLKEEAKKLANDKGISLASLVDLALEELLKEEHIEETKENKESTYTFRINSEDKTKLFKIANDKDMSASSLICLALEDYLEANSNN